MPHTHNTHNTHSQHTYSHAHTHSATHNTINTEMYAHTHTHTHTHIPTQVVVGMEGIIAMGREGVQDQSDLGAHLLRYTVQDQSEEKLMEYYITN